MNPDDLFRSAARCWERVGRFDRAAERYARTDAWADAGRCWAQAGRPVEAAEAYARAGEPISEARQWLASPWPERARQPYGQALLMELTTAAEVEALLGVGEIDLASERALKVASENGRAMEALRSLAKIAAARGRPDLAAYAWSEAITCSPAATPKFYEEWERMTPWNRSLAWKRPQGAASRWPSREFRDVRLELIWEEELGTMMYGNRALAWSADGRRFAAAKDFRALILGDLTGRGVRYLSVDMAAISVTFGPESDSVLVGCEGGEVVKVDASGAFEEVEGLRMPNQIWEVSISPRGDRVAVSGWTSPGSLLRIFTWGQHSARALIKEKEAQQDKANPSLAWSQDGRTLAWCPGPCDNEAIPNDLYLFSDAGTRRVIAAHENGVNGTAFSPDGRYLLTVSTDRTIALRGAHTGEHVAPPRKFAQRLVTIHLHPYVTLMAAGGTADFYGGFRSPSQLYLFRLSQSGPAHLEVIQESATDAAVCSLAFSPDGEHLLMSTNEKLSLFRVHLS